MKEIYEIFDIVALLNDIPEKHLLRGQVGTIVEIHSPDIFEVEFNDDDGQTYAMTSLEKEKLIKLHYSRAA